MKSDRNDPQTGLPDENGPKRVTADAEIVAHVWEIAVDVGAHVTKGEQVALVESMKMEIPVFAPATGIVTQLLSNQGDLVQEGDPIIEIAVDEPDVTDER